VKLRDFDTQFRNSRVCCREMTLTPSTRLKEYAGALLATAIAAALDLALQRTGYLGLSPLMAAVVVSAWYGGLGPGVVSLVLTSVIAYYLLPRHDSARLNEQDLLRAAVFSAVALFASALHFVTRRAREVAEKARDAAEKSRLAAEQANAAKTRFLAMVSHELRNPLGPVLMAVAAIETLPNLSERVIEELQTIRRNVAVQVRLIDDLVDVARVVNGKLKFLVTLVDLHDPLKAAIRACQDGIQDKQLELRTDFSATHTSVYGDAGRLQQVFWNLLRNAIKFTPERGWIAVRTCNDSDGWVSVDIADSGIGIEKVPLSGIFTAFEQGGDRMTQKYGGLGLGLSICGALIDAHGGTVTAASDGTGKGATFTVRIPLRAGGKTVEQNQRAFPSEVVAESAQRLIPR
jgi:signal transduction histidine kinase